MSTRACVAKVWGDGWSGVYTHWDGYPTHQGPIIWAKLHEECGGNSDVFIERYIDAHPSGWSSFGEICYCHNKDFPDHEPMIITSDDERHNQALYTEWVYVIGKRVLTVYTSDKRDSPLENQYGWEIVAQVPLDGPEPDWGKLEEEVG